MGTEVNLRDVGKRLRRLRGELSQELAAAEAGVSQDMVSRCERGLAYPPPNYLFWIAARGLVSVDWVLTGRNVDQYSKALEEAQKKYGAPVGRDERALLDSFRKAPPEIQKAIRILLKM